MKDVPRHYDEPPPGRDALEEMVHRRYPAHPDDFHYLGDALDLTEEQRLRLLMNYFGAYSYAGAEQSPTDYATPNNPN